MEKPWYRSKTKWGALLLSSAQAAKGSGLIPGEYLALVQLAESVGLALAGFGIRDAVAPK